MIFVMFVCGINYTVQSLVRLTGKLDSSGEDRIKVRLFDVVDIDGD